MARDPGGAVMPQIAVLDTTGIDALSMAFYVKAWDAYAQEVAAAWGCLYTPVVPYPSIPLAQPPAELRIAKIVADTGQPGILGWHDDEGGTPEIITQIDALPHEIAEEEVDPTADVWRPMPDGRQVALEVCDPCEGQDYPVAITIGGETRQIALPNYVLPTWFDPAGKAPFDKRGILTAPFQVGAAGYIIVEDGSGNVSNVFGDRTRVSPSFLRKLENPRSRLLRRHRNPPRPRVTSPVGQP